MRFVEHGICSIATSTMNELFLSFWPDALCMHETAIFPLPVKSDVTVVFLDPDFLTEVKILAILVHLKPSSR